jgi:Fe-S-cluster containining protein
MGGSMPPERRHFRCTECGACCNRSPEVGLSEAAGLSDVFVFRLMFRLHRLPRHLSDYRKADNDPPMAKAYFEKRQLLSQFSTRKNVVKVRTAVGSFEYIQYLVLSALPMDIPQGSCSELSGNRCGIYERRPLSCQTVPFHYSRTEALAQRDFDAFVNRTGYHCDTNSSAEIVLENGRIVKKEALEARASALELAGNDRVWSDAILRRVKHNDGDAISLPSLKDIEVNASIGAMTATMRIAWHIAAEAGLISVRQYRGLVASQLLVIERELTKARCSRDDLELLAQMQTEYRHHLIQ